MTSLMPDVDAVGVVQDFLAQEYPHARAVTKVPGDDSFIASLPIIRVQAAGGTSRRGLTSARISILILIKRVDGRRDIPSAAADARQFGANVIQRLREHGPGFGTVDGYITGTENAGTPTAYDYGNPAVEAVAFTITLHCRPYAP